MAPAAAFAQTDPSTDAYRDAGPQVQDRIDQGNPTDENGGTTPVVAAAEDESGPSGGAGGGESGELPFTGLDVALVLGAGALLLALGVGMRRLTRPTREVA